MAVHAVKIVCSTNQKDKPDVVPKPEPPSLPSVVSDRVVQNVKDVFSAVKEFDEEPAHKAQADETTGRPEHVRGRYRFSSAENKTDLLEKVRDSVVQDAEWYEIRYHLCRDDEENQGCPDWEVAEDSNGNKMSSGPVPEAV